ncbi:hypothetical protein [Streptomyces sp. NPDC059176]|uniref:hypothetical protein n=1 Tax=unclassified Streptomyces TaxID=2593676 RepID=UPI0036B0D2C5
MRTARAALAGGALAVLALGSAAPLAAADESEVSVSPRVAAPGSTVTVSTSACGPDVTYAKGQAEAGGQINMVENQNEGELAGDFTVPGDAKDGVYSITVKCPPSTRATADFEVARQPNGPVRGGFGGASGLNSTEIVIGSLLLAAAATGGAIRMRNRMNSSAA